MAQGRTIAIAAISGMVGLVVGAVLDKLHTGDVEGASLTLNSRLDSELIAIRYVVKDGFKLPAGGASAIARIGRVRGATGYSPPDDSVRESVEAALRLGKTLE